MKLDTVWRLRRENATKASEVVRTLGLAGIALIWVLRPEQSNRVQWEMLIPGGLIVIALLLDVIQLLVMSRRWKSLGDRKNDEFRRKLDTVADQDEREKLSKEWNEREFNLPIGFHRPGSMLFWAKIAFVGAAYLVIFSSIIQRLVCPL